MSDRQKVLALVGVAVFALAIVAFLALRPSDGATDANVADFAKSIDNTKGDTPSVPSERLSLGRTGGKKGGR